MELSKYIDHTLLKADATVDQIKTLCEEAAEYNFMSVCINPVHIPLAKELLADSDVKVCTVIGFPLGANATAVKAFEAKTAVEDGADEVDMVINIGAAKAGDWETVEKDVRAVVEAVPKEVVVKVIIETSLLNDEEKTLASQAAQRGGTDFVKTSTGFSTGGATLEDVTLMRQAVGPDLGVKASGGVSNYAEAMAMIEVGATRIGASKGIAIVTQKPAEVTSDDNY
ncbi:deoxyribose-phosphate aldolase [Aerococcaceae bacterium DSM 109653]|uniref:Deoxyribose-phosphate aldolase n=1 Tax=Fundicoccus ignavus TaxID=2664442 RepID=A0A844BFF0_9LACT|nr:deoxyribose-phosphate aldolase [Fundicoccus ignavus]MRI80690.1 deoxyribose-phosphate aldolase [Fundicoccus ignavus]